jgi:hypothetical protein
MRAPAHLWCPRPRQSSSVSNPYSASGERRKDRAQRKRHECGRVMSSTAATVWCRRTTPGNDPAQTAINYWPYDVEARKFRIIFFSNNGLFTEDGNRYEGEIANWKLTFTGPARFQYDLERSRQGERERGRKPMIRWRQRDRTRNFSPGAVDRDPGQGVVELCDRRPPRFDNRLPQLAGA